MTDGPRFADRLLGGAPSGSARPAVAAADAAQGMPSYADRLIGDIMPTSGRNGRTATGGQRQFPEGSPSYDESRAADALTIQNASFARTPEGKVRALAKGMFPDLPVEQAARMFVVQGDDLTDIYVRGIGSPEENAKLYRVVPSGMSPEALYKNVQTLAGPITEYGPATVVGTATAPMLLAGPAGLTASMSATGGAAAGGSALRQAIAQAVAGEDPSLSRMALTTGQAALGQGLGAGLASWSQRGVAADINRLNPQQVSALQAKAQAEGIQLTPAEMTNMPSLKGQQKALGNLPQSSDGLNDFYRNRMDQIDAAVTRFMGRVSPNDSAETAGQGIRQTADDAIARLRADRQAQASPLYNRVMTAENNMEAETWAALRSNRLVASAVDYVRRSPIYNALDDLPDNNIQVLDLAKRRLDDLAEEATRAGRRNEARLIGDVRDNLVSTMDDAFAGYAQARDAYAGASPAVDAAENSIVGIIRNLRDDRLQTAAARLFDPASTGPRAVSQARALLQRENPQAWQDIKRAWLQQQWDRAGQETLGSGSEVINRGPKFRALLLGEPQRRRTLQAALDPPEWRALNQLADVLEAAGRVKPVGSDTAWNQEAMKLARERATPLLAKGARLLRPQDWGKMVEDWSTERALAANANRLVEIITSPNGIAQLRELRRISPQSVRFQVLLSHMLTTGAPEAVASAVE